MTTATTGNPGKRKPRPALEASAAEAAVEATGVAASQSSSLSDVTR